MVKSMYPLWTPICLPPEKKILQGANDIMSMLVMSLCCSVIKHSLIKHRKQLWDKLHVFYFLSVGFLENV